MLELPQVTVVCVDCINHEAAALALSHCTAKAHFAEAILIADKSPANLPTGVRFAQIPRLASREAYSNFMLNGLGTHVATSHVLVVQWDGYVLNPEAWTDAFLAFDYIGAKWWHTDGMNVGNGGFSLRSRKLLDAVRSLGLVNNSQNEDEVICRIRRVELEQIHGIRFADEETADRFAFERGQVPGSVLPFGFHGLFNMHRVLDPQSLRNLFAILNARTIAYVETIELAQAYFKAGKHEEAVFVCTRALDVSPDSRNALSILVNSAVQGRRFWLAVMALKELLRIEPNNADYLGVLGDIYAYTSRIAEAQIAYRRVLELRPRDQATMQKMQKLASQAPHSKQKSSQQVGMQATLQSTTRAQPAH